MVRLFCCLESIVFNMLFAMDGGTFFFIAIAVFIIVCYIQKQTYKGLLKIKEKKFEKESSILRKKILT